MRQEDLRWGELVTLMGWPWKLALALLTSGAVLLWLPQTGGAEAAASAWNGEVALAAMAAAALLALGSGLHTLRALLCGAAEDPASDNAEARELITGLRQLLEEQQWQVHEAAAAASRAVATAAQLSGLAHDVEKQFRQTLEHAVSGVASIALPGRLESPRSEAMLTRLEACARQAESIGDKLLTLPALAHRMEESSQHLQRSAVAVAAAEGMLQALPAAAVRMAAGAERLEVAARALDHLPDSTRSLSAAAQALGEQSKAVQLQSSVMEGLLEEAMGRLGDSPAQNSTAPAERLEELVRSLGNHVERVLRNEATLGDAARYLTETTDRFTGGLAALETHAVRLQAMISITGSREAETAPLREELNTLRQQVTAMAELTHSLHSIQQRLDGTQPLPPTMRATLEQLGTVEAEAARLLQEAATMPQQILPPAFASRTTKLLQAVQENIRNLHAAAGGTSPAAVQGTYP